MPPGQILCQRWGIFRQMQEKPSKFALRGTRIMIWAYGIAAVLALGAAGIYRDGRYIVQALIGAVLAGYFLWILRKVERSRHSRE